MRKILLLTILSLFLALCSNTAIGQSVPQGNAFDLVDPGRELRDRLEQQRREDEVQRFQSRDPAIRPSIVNPEGENEGPCIQVNEIEVEGVTALRESQLKEILKDRAPNCLRRFHISNLMRTLDKAYVDQGLITARTYIPKQNIQQTGILKLQVVEGYVEDIKLIENGEGKTGALSKLKTFTAFPDKLEKELNIRDFEQGLEQLNRLSSVQAKMRLEPGEKSGGSLVIIDSQTKDRVRGSIGWDNFGSRSTGQREGRIQLSADNLFLANDTASLVYVGSTNANALNAAFSIPLGYNTLTVSGSFSDYLIPLSDVSELFSETQSYTVSMDRVISRNSQSILHVSGAVRYRESQRFVNGFALSPQNTTVSDIRLRQISNEENARWSWELGLRSGLHLFGGLTDNGPLDDSLAHSEFHAFDFSISRFGKKNIHGRWSTIVKGQIANYALLGNEQLTIGSQSTVRGFEEPLLGADVGAVIRHEGTFDFPNFRNERNQTHGDALTSFKRRSRPYMFIDSGVGYSYGADQYQLAVGVGAGLRFYAKRLQMDVALQTGLVNQSSLGLKQGQTRLTASATLKTF